MSVWYHSGTLMLGVTTTCIHAINCSALVADGFNGLGRVHAPQTTLLTWHQCKDLHTEDQRIVFQVQ